MTSRRDFIKKTAASTAAMTLGSIVLPRIAHANVLGANEQINCAVIGVRS
ncbi:MAG: twin-arginine translocation signal domain-containing protein, partial [Eudoraea sp.]|nr:twin-arginine translocation signal domain-containing protein [Eudoraea sp.]